MHKFFRIINQNRKKIIIAVCVIVFAIIIRQAMNNVAKEDLEIKMKETQNEIEQARENTSTYNPSYAISSQSTIGEELLNENVNLITIFVEYCNNGETQKAYDLLSDDCKTELYPTLNSFVKNYYNNNFKTKRLCSIQAWVSNSLTYKVELFDDVLASGKVNNTTIQDYFTIVRQDDEEKLNISEYIGEKAINKSISKNGLEIIIKSKKIYKEYEKYTIKVINKTNYDILIDSGETSKNVYLISSTNTKHSSYLYEISMTKLKVKSYTENELNIRFNKQYTSSSKITEINFDDIILNADEYEKATNKKNYKNRTKITINI